MMIPTPMASPLPHPDVVHFRAAQGWMELGNAQEAAAELEKISPSLRTHPDVLELRWHINARAKDWHACIEVAEATIRIAPERPDPWIHRSFALHELRRTQEAFENLLPMAEKFPEVWTIPYNLACYCAQLGRLNDSKTWFTKAMAIDADASQRVGIEDPDLKPLWDCVGKPRKGPSK